LVKNSALYFAGDPADEIYFILRGSVKIVLPAISNKDTKSRYLSINKLAVVSGLELGEGIRVNLNFG
jgi:hypothetical protein